MVFYSFDVDALYFMKKMKKPRLLVIAPQFFPTIGGYEISTLRILKELSKKMSAIYVITERSSKELKKFEIKDGINIYRWWCIKQKKLHTPTSIMGLFFKLLKFSRKTNIWYIPTVNLFTIFTIIIGKILQKKIIIRSATTGKLGINNIFRNSILRPLLNKIIFSTDYIIVPSLKALDEAKTFGFNEKKVRLISNGVDIRRFVKYTQKDIKLLKERYKTQNFKVVIYVGRLSPEKNPLGLLKSWSQINIDLYKSWKLLYVGDGPQYQELIEEVKKLSLQSSVEIIGAQKNISDWLNISEIFVQPSLDEGMSNALLEAMSCSLPIISTNVGGSNIVSEGKCGYVVERNNEDAFSNAMQNLMSDQEQRNKYSLKAREIIQRNYSLTICSEKYLNLYEDLINK